MLPIRVLAFLSSHSSRHYHFIPELVANDNEVKYSQNHMDTSWANKNQRLYCLIFLQKQIESTSHCFCIFFYSYSEQALNIDNLLITFFTMKQPSALKPATDNGDFPSFMRISPLAFIPAILRLYPLAKSTNESHII